MQHINNNPALIALFVITALVSAFLSANSALAGSGKTIEELQQAAKDKQLWKKVQWINLLHYNKEGFFSAHVSQVDDDRFFNAKDGKTNPEAELLSTIAAFYRTDTQGDDHPICRFVSRLNWLTEEIYIDRSTLPKPHCKDYEDWRKSVKAEHVTMIFPAYHLNSPSSMFGHTLLRLDKKINGNESKWLSYAVNFGADTKAEDNSIIYAFKGLAGGYPGIFIVAPYFKKIQEYNQIENRDIWEYSLDLNAEETERLVTHLWELKEMNFDYYFFDENCSYRLLELLEVARPSIEITDEFVLTAIPVDTVRAVERTGMIDHIEYRPSRATNLQFLLDTMPESDHDYVKKLSEDDSFATNNSFVSLPEERQRQIVDAAYQFLRYQEESNIRDPEKAKRSYKLLELLNQYPAEKQKKIKIPESDPGKSHLSRRVSLSTGEREDKDFIDIGYKFSFHDLEDNEYGFLQGAQINIVDFEFRRYSDESLKLHQLDFVNIFSITPRTDFFNPLTWKIYTGIERQPFNNDEQKVSHVTGGAGVGYSPWENSQFYSLLMLRLEHNNFMNNNIEPALGVLTGLLHHFGWSTAHIELSGEEFKNDLYRTRAIYTHNFVFSTNHSLKLITKREWHSTIRFSEFSLSYQYYF